MSKKSLAIARAAGIIGAVSALTVGITFANLTTSASLTGNTIATATASLLVWDGDSFETSATGFAVTGLVPGTGVELPFYLKNDGGVPLNLSVNVPVAPSSSGFSGWENLLVTITDDNGSTVTSTNMQALLGGNVVLTANPLSAGAQGNSGVPGTEGNFHIEFDINPSSINANQVNVGSFDLVFTGTST